MAVLKTGQRTGSRPQPPEAGARSASLEPGRSPVYFQHSCLSGTERWSSRFDLGPAKTRIFLQEGLDRQITPTARRANQGRRLGLAGGATGAKASAARCARTPSRQIQKNKLHRRNRSLGRRQYWA